MKPETRARLIEVARLRAAVPTYKELSLEIGVTELYARKLVSEMVRAIRHKGDVSLKPSRKFSHTAAEIEQIADEHEKGGAL